LAHSGAVPRVSDERLCWLAVADEVGKIGRRVGFWGWVSALGAGSTGRSGKSGAAMSGSARRERTSDRMADFAFAVDDAAATLNQAERAVLRSTGAVPDWFLADVVQRAKVIEKSR
jgi:hypothetical protein